MLINDEIGEDIANIGKILKLHENDKSLCVESIECLPGSQQGDNYMSVIKRVHVNGKCKNGDEDYKISLIIKRQIASRSRRQLFRCDEAFSNEISAYCSLMPVMRKFSNNSLPYPKCLFAGSDDDGDVVILEDLKRRGYNMVNRLKGLDFQQCRVVMQELGNLHAVSLAMKAIQPNTFHSARQNVNEIVFCAEAAEFYTHSLESSLRGALSSLQSSNVNGILDIPIKCLAKLKGNVFKMMCQNVFENDELWTVICHGDLWTNNLMFNEDNSSVKIVDLQAIRYTSPVIDILHLLYSSTEKEVRLKYLDELFAQYHQSLLDSLRLYMLPVNKDKFDKLEQVFSVENIKSEFKKKVLYGLGIAMWLLPAVTFHPDHIPNLDTVTMNDFTSCTHEKTIAQMYTPEYHMRMKEVVLEFYDKGYLNVI